MTLAEGRAALAGPVAPAQRAGGALAPTTSKPLCPAVMTGSWRRSAAARAALPRTAFRPGPLSVAGESTGRLAGSSRKQLDGDLQALAEEFAVPATLVEEVRDVLSLPRASGRSGGNASDGDVWARWGSRYGGVGEAGEEGVGRVVRARSGIENPNSRLRSYFFLRAPSGRGLPDAVTVLSEPPPFRAE